MWKHAKSHLPKTAGVQISKLTAEAKRDSGGLTEMQRPVYTGLDG